MKENRKTDGDHTATTCHTHCSRDPESHPGRQEQKSSPQRAHMQRHTEKQRHESEV